MEVIMFGRSELTRESLLTMQPHVRTECLALMRESGNSENKIARSFSVSRHAVQQIISARHQYSLPSAAEDRPAPEPIPDKVLARAPIGRDALRLLRRVAIERRGWTVGKATIAREVGISDVALRAAMAELVNADMLVRLGETSQGRAPCYAATPKGVALLASLAVEA